MKLTLKCLIPFRYIRGRNLKIVSLHFLLLRNRLHLERNEKKKKKKKKERKKKKEEKESCCVRGTSSLILGNSDIDHPSGHIGFALRQNSHSTLFTIFQRQIVIIYLRQMQ
jgi:hypothetical protein